MHPLRTTPKRLLASAVAVVVMTSGCSLLGGGAEPPQDLIDQMPTQFDGELYFEAIVDGSCSTDCPDPAIARGWLVPCDQLQQRFDGAVGYFESLGYAIDASAIDPDYPNNDENGYSTDLFGGERDATANVLGRSDPENGSQPNVTPFETPASVEGRCAVVLTITRPRTS